MIPSPYLFILVIDVLQQLIKGHGGVYHPLDVELPCTILQYADDTLIIYKAARSDITALKHLLAQLILHCHRAEYQLLQKHHGAHECGDRASSLDCGSHRLQGRRLP